MNHDDALPTWLYRSEAFAEDLLDDAEPEPAVPVLRSGGLFVLPALLAVAGAVTMSGLPT